MKRRSLFKSIAAVVGFNLLAQNFSVTESPNKILTEIEAMEEWLTEATKYFWNEFYKERYDQLAQQHR